MLFMALPIFNKWHSLNDGSVYVGSTSGEMQRKQLRCRWWPNITPALDQHPLFSGHGYG